MRVQFNNIYSISFKAHKKEIRDADDIQRQARKTFPFISSSYVDEFYLTADKNKFEKKNQRAREISDKLYAKLRVGRNIVKYPFLYGLRVSDFEKEIPYAMVLSTLPLIKTGNCHECAVASLAALTANGYYDSHKIDLMLETQLINKKTGEVENTTLDSLDHSFVVSSMGKNSDKEEDQVVLDSWLGFADSVSGAKARFKQIYSDDYLDEIYKKNRSLYRLEKAKQGEAIFFDDYECKQKMVFKRSDPFTEKQMQDLGLYSRIIHEQLWMKKHEI